MTSLYAFTACSLLALSGIAARTGTGDPLKAIGVAVSDSPTGPFVDARGSALISNSMTKMAAHSWDDIDPTVFQDDDGTPWLWWGNQILYYAKLAPNMIELDGPIRTLDIAPYEEGPWIHKHDGTYYLLYAAIDRSVSDDEQVEQTPEGISVPPRTAPANQSSEKGQTP